MIGIRVDVNNEIATGHIMRTMAVARRLQDMGQSVVFVCADENALPYLKGSNFRVHILNSDWKKLDEELPCLIELLVQYGIKSLLIDSYQVTPNYMRALSKIVKVTYFDEMYIKGYGCQQVINGVLDPPKYDNINQKAFTGPDFVALREEFSNLPGRVVNDRIKSLLVTSGGSDYYHFCKTFLEDFLKQEWLNEISIVLIVGGLCDDKEELIQKYTGNSRISLFVNTDKMSELMEKADYAVTAGGTTLYELCATGLPGSSYVVGDNQERIVKSFDDYGLIRYAGDFRKDPRGVINQIYNDISLSQEYGLRSELANKLQKVVDGRGAQRIAEIIV